MKTRLHRLYRNRIADVNIVDEPLDTKIENTKQNTHPVGEDIVAPKSYHEDALKTAADEEGKKGVIFAIKPTKEAALEICDAMHGLEIDPEYLHVTLVYLGKDLTPEQVETVKKIGAEVCAAHKVLNCKTQGLGVFDHVDEDEGGKPFYASVDALGMAQLRTDLLNEIVSAGVELDQRYDFTPHMTLAYIDPNLIPFGDGSPGVEWSSDEVILMNGEEQVALKLGGDHGVDDEKTGEVEAPYSSGHGPLSVNEDQKVDTVRAAHLTMRDIE